MALATIGTPDLSLVTDDVIARINACIASWPMWQSNNGPVKDFTIRVTGAMPESLVDAGECQLSWYLLQVRESPYLRNASIQGSGVQPPQHPLALVLVQFVGLDELRMLIVLGGPMGVSDIGNEKYPFLAKELDTLHRLERML